MKIKKLDMAIVCTFITMMLNSATYPAIHREMMAVVSDNLIAVSQIADCVSVIIFGWVWNRWGAKLYKFYPTFCILEAFTTVVTTTYVVTTHHIVSYYIIDMVFFSFISRQTICGDIKLKAIRYPTEETRTAFENNNNSIYAVAVIVGSTVAMKLELDFNIMIIIATIGNIVGDMIYIYIYYHNNINK